MSGDVGGWFIDHGLPFTSDIANDLDDWGVKNVEEMKLLKLEDFLELFENEKKIIKRKAEAVYKDDLTKKSFSAKRSVNQLPLKHPSSKKHKSSEASETSKSTKLNRKTGLRRSRKNLPNPLAILFLCVVFLAVPNVKKSITVVVNQNDGVTGRSSLP